MLKFCTGLVSRASEITRALSLGRSAKVSCARPSSSAFRFLQDFVARHEEIRDNKTSIVRAMAPVLRAADDYAMLRHFISRGHFGGTELVSSRDRTPMAYGRELDRCARDRNINPFFVWSIMTIESDLNPDSVSVADAYGLLQVIPKTGELMADRFGKGIRSKYLALDIKSVDGSTLTLDALRLHLDKINKER